ncbi:MAG: SIS domain-containing protein [Gammaproteobacteria bacterium]|nr:SIS domain-containing protein [Gammaproteobacteria bacterium]
MNCDKWIETYIEAQIRVLRELPVKDIARFVNIVQQTLEDNKQLIMFGNGGNAASASHFAADMGKGASDAIGQRFRVLSLNDNLSWLTAIGNDYAYEDVFYRQLENMAQAGDVLICGSVSGNSPNCVKAFEWGQQNGLTSVAITSSRKGRLAELATLPIVVPDEHYGRVEDVQMMIYHMVAFAFMELGLNQA